jgi:hypothetical protein
MTRFRPQPRDYGGQTRFRQDYGLEDGKEPMP